MASRVSSATRAVQKKLRKIVLNVLKLEETEGILDNLDDPIPAAEFLVNEDGIDKYGDDVLAFKADVDATCKFISKMRGKKPAAAVILSTFTALLEQEFPDVFAAEMEVEEPAEVPASSKKRGRPSVESAASVESPERQPKKKAARQVVEEAPEAEEGPGLSAAEKTALKAIIAKLMKAPEAEYFLYPVDASAYPEYYQMIVEPMDLTTVKQKLGEYGSAQEALADLRLIWENCRTFNAEGSEILQSAEACAGLLEALVEEKLGEAYLLKKKRGRKSNATLAAERAMEAEPAPAAPAAEVKTPKQKRKRAGGPSHQVDQEGWPVRPRALWTLPADLLLSRSTMKTLVRDVSGSDFAEPFLAAVDPEEAPGYAELIKTPMDLGTMKKRITSGMYDHDGGAFVSDMRLIWENCVLYNDPASEIALFAAKLGEVFEEHLGGVLTELADAEAAQEAEAQAAAAASASASKPKGKKIKEEVVEEEPAESVKKGRKPKESKEVEEEGEAEAKKPASANMKKMKRILKAFYQDDRSLPFREPVPVDEVPGYAELISTPMDLSTVKAQLASYDETPGKFLRDMRLIFDNCQKFNVEESGLYVAAGELRDLVDSMFSEAFPPVDHAAEAAMKIKIAAKAARKAAAMDHEAEEKPAASSASAGMTLKLSKHSAAASKMDVEDSANEASAPSASSSAPMAVNLQIPVPKVTARMQSLPTKLEDLTALAAELASPTLDAASNALVRERAFHKAYDKLRATRVPYVVAPDLYVVKKFGDLYPDYKCHDEKYIYPIGYSCSRVMRLAVVPDNVGSNVAASVKPWVPVELKSTVYVGGAQSNEASFQVALENGTIVSEGATPRAAWEGLFGKEEQVMQLLGGKLQRCRAVFNRLAVSPDALPFLEMVPQAGPIGQSYYSVITAPMWFREVHSRLVEGTYDVEFDFAWDMRLIFKNCMEYNTAGSELYEAAERLIESFEHLFANWVLNVQDRSVEDLAKGPWDQWQSLKYFDFADPTVNICAVTGTRAPASQLLQCRCCEDQNLASLHPPVHSKSLWVCPRCQDALDMAGGDLTSNPFSAMGYKGNRADTYSAEEFGGNSFVPAPEFGVGWFQAKRRLRAGLKNTFLSPLGYEVLAKEDIPNQVIYENIVNQNLYTARAAEFQEAMNTKKPRHEVKKTARHKRVTSEPMSPEKQTPDDSKASTTVAPAIDPLAAEEAGKIPAGKLYNYQIPEGHRLVWLTCADEAAALQKAAAGQDVYPVLADRTVLSADQLPLTGYFGFDIPAIRSRIEGVEGSITCKEYVYTDTAKIRDAILDDVLNAKRRLEMLSTSEEALRKVLLDERWRFERQLLTPPQPASVEASTVSERKAGFSALFPDSFRVVDCDTVLALFEFMALCPSLYKTIDAYSLHDLTCSLVTPSSALPTYGQVVFDEVCCNLTQLMLNELRNRSDIKDELSWQNILMVRPVNIVTWPSLALETLRLLAFPVSPAEVGTGLEMHALPAHVMKQRDILCLLLNHPVIDTFLVQITMPEGQDGTAVNKVTLDLRAMKDHFSNIEAMSGSGEGAEAKYATLEAFCTAARQLFLDVLALPDVPAQRVLHAHCLVAYLNDMFKRWNITVPEAGASELYPAPSADDLIAQLRAEKLSPWRFWGGFTLSNVDIPKTQVVLPSTFSTVVESDFDRRMKALDALEKTILLLGQSEPESWKTADRTTVYSTLLEQCLVCREVVGTAHQRQTLLNTKLGGYAESAVVLEHLPQLEYVKHTPAGTKCHFTGIDVDHSLDRVQWVAVPTAYLSSGISTTAKPAAAEATASGSNGRGTRSVNNTYTGPVALHAALMKVATARETALADARKHENRVISILQPNLYEDPKTTGLYKTLENYRGADPQRSASYCSQPLGYDRRGNAYWLLSAQESTTLFPYQPNGTAITITNSASTGGKAPVEPCVLLREPGGWWGYHNGTELPALLSSFSSEILCERVLLLRMIEKLAYARCLLHSRVLTVRAMQRDWVVRRIRAESWVHNFKLPTENLSPEQMNRLLELVWGRCVEVRNHIHTSSYFKTEDDPPLMNTPRAEKENMMRKQNKFRAFITDHTFDLRAAGWGGNDALHRIRQTAASTTATRIIADPTITEILCRVLLRSPYLVRNDPAPVVPGQGGQALGGDDEDGDGAPAPKAITAPPAAVAVAAPTPVAPAAAVEATPAAVENVAAEPTQVAQLASDSAAVTSEMEVEEAGTAKTESVEKAEAPEPAVKESAPAVAATAEESTPMDVATEAPATATAEPTPSTTAPPAAAPAAFATAPPAPTITIQAAPGYNRPWPDLRAVIQATSSSNLEMRTKVIELRHLITGELLRVFPTGKDGAAFFSVAQSGISLCLHNTKPDYLGFKWRQYNGPNIKWEAIANVQPSLKIIMAMQVTKHNAHSYDAEAEQQIVTRLYEQERHIDPSRYSLPSAVATAVANAPPLPAPVPFKPWGSGAPVPPKVAAPASTSMPSAPPRPASGGYLPPRPMGFQPNLLPHITTSSVVVSARMLKLKAELLNLFYLMPDKVLRLPELDEVGEKAIADAGAEAAANIRAGLAKISSANSTAAAASAAPAPAADSADADAKAAPAAAAAPSTAVAAPSIDLSMSNVERLVEKATRKAKRRLRRKLSVEKFLRDTQEATAPQQLLVLVTTLENALPPAALYKYNHAQVPVAADTLAAVAVRLFVLDRAIAYADIKAVENNVAQCPFRLRGQFYPRCVLMTSCNRCIGHINKCSNMIDGSGSRIPEFQDMANITRIGGGQLQYQAPMSNRPGYAMSAAQLQAQANQRKLAYMQQMAALKPKDEDVPLEEVLKKLLQVRKELDIETIQPYYPVKDITAMDWI